MAKGVSYYMGLPYTLVLHPDPTGGYVVSVPELPGCLSQGETADEALRMIEDAKRCWIETALEDGYPVPEPDQSYSGKLLLRMPQSLHRVLAEQAKAEGVSLNQLILYHISRSVGLPYREEAASRS